MGVSTIVNRVTYAGDGTTTMFSFPYYFFQASDFIIYLYNTVTAASVRLTLGVDYTVAGSANFQGIFPSGGVVTILTSTLIPTGTIPTGTTLTIIRAPGLLQNYGLIQNGVINGQALTQELDYLTLLIQRLEDRVTRAVRLPDSVPATFSSLLPNNITLSPGTILIVSLDGKSVTLGPTIASITSGSGGSALLGLPTDGAYGTHQSGDTSTAGPITGIDKGITIDDAFDDVENTFQKLAPSPPPNLSATALIIVGTYASFASGTGTAAPNTINTTSPLIKSAAAFADGSKGTLSATVDGASVGSLSIVSGTTGTNNLLQITSNADPYVGQFGKAGFYFALLAQINETGMTTGNHVAILTHSITGSATLSFDVDDSGTPAIGTTSAVGSGTAGTISGVPALLTGGVITPTFTVSNAVKSHYNSTRIGAATLFGVTVNAALPGTPPANGASVVVSPALSVVAGQYTETPSLTLTGYAANGTTGTATITPSIRVDSLSNESARFVSGTGQYPTIGSGAGQFGATYSSTQLLSANKELQLLGGSYQYPPLVSYTGNLPTAGPDYTGLTTDSYASMRWVTFKWGTLAAATSLTINLNGTANFGASTVVSGIAFYVLVDGSAPTAGWVDGNTAYPGVGNPTNNGDPALDIANSTATLKKITFGSAPKTGNVWVRLGIPSGSNKKLGSIS